MSAVVLAQILVQGVVQRTPGVVERSAEKVAKFILCSLAMAFLPPQVLRVGCYYVVVRLCPLSKASSIFACSWTGECLTGVAF